MIWLSLLALNYLSWALLCLATQRAYRQHFGGEPSRKRQRLLRTSGWTVALLAYGCSVVAAGWSLGSVNACAAWMLAAVAWVLLHTYRPSAARWLAFAAPAVVLFTLIAPAAIAIIDHQHPTAFFGAP